MATSRPSRPSLRPSVHASVRPLALTALLAAAVHAQPPNLLVTAGLHDSQVQYWESAKWVAKLRALKTDQNRLLLHTNMEAGHGGASGRFERYRETARNWAFLLDLAGLADVPPADSE